MQCITCHAKLFAKLVILFHLSRVCIFGKFPFSKVCQNNSRCLLPVTHSRYANECVKNTYSTQVVYDEDFSFHFVVQVTMGIYERTK